MYWCSLQIYHRPLEISVNKNCQIGVHAHVTVGGHVPQSHIDGDAGVTC